MRIFKLSLFILLSTCLINAQKDDVKVSLEMVDGLQTMTHQVVVESSLKEIWHLFTTAEGTKSWIAPFANIDFREGGVSETSYNPNASPGHEDNIVSHYTKIVPMKYYESKLDRAPKDNPYGKVLMDLKSRVAMEDLGDGKVKVSIAMIGWNDSEEHQSVRKFFEGGNRWYFQRLIKRCKEGPLPWEGFE